MLLRVALALLSILLLAHGGEGLYAALRSRTQAQLSCDQYLGQGSPSAWVRITGCELDYLNAGYRDTSASWRGMLPGAGFRISELLFPARPRGADQSSPAALIVATRDPVVLAIAERSFGSADARDQESFLVTMLQVVTAMRASREVDGMLRRPLEMLRTRASLSAIRAPLADGVAVLDLHERPDAFRPAVEVLAGLLALWPFARSRRHSLTSAAANAPSMPLMMLLNLAPGDTQEDIESAPPLGSQDEVREQIATALPGIVFDGTGRGTFTLPAGSLDVDLRTEEPVYTAVLTVRGAAGPVLARLLDETGWRAYAPKPGAFVSAADVRRGRRS